MLSWGTIAIFRLSGSDHRVLVLLMSLRPVGQDRKLWALTCRLPREIVSSTDVVSCGTRTGSVGWELLREMADFPRDYSLLASVSNYQGWRRDRFQGNVFSV